MKGTGSQVDVISNNEERVDSVKGVYEAVVEASGSCATSTEYCALSVPVGMRFLGTLRANMYGCERTCHKGVLASRRREKKKRVLKRDLNANPPM